MQNNFSTLLSIYVASVLFVLWAVLFEPVGSIQRRAKGKARGLDNMTLENWKNSLFRTRAVILKLSENVFPRFPQSSGQLCQGTRLMHWATWQDVAMIQRCFGVMVRRTTSLAHFLAAMKHYTFYLGHSHCCASARVTMVGILDSQGPFFKLATFFTSVCFECWFRRTVILKAAPHHRGACGTGTSRMIKG